jgi:hypothetical protein
VDAAALATTGAQRRIEQSMPKVAGIVVADTAIDDERDVSAFGNRRAMICGMCFSCLRNFREKELTRHRGIA